MRLLSVVVPLKDERDNVRPLVERVRDALRGCRPWELVLVDDGSTDGTFAELEAVAAADPRVKVVRLRRNFGQTAATQAGLDAAAGDVDRHHGRRPAERPGRHPAAAREARRGLRRGPRPAARTARTSSCCARCRAWSANWLIRKVLGVPFKDFGCTLRAMRRDVARRPVALRRDAPLHHGARDPAGRAGGAGAGPAPPADGRASRSTT